MNNDLQNPLDNNTQPSNVLPNVSSISKYGREWDEGFKSNRIPQPITNPVDIIQNAPIQIFSGMYGYMQWFFGLRWYVILLVLVFFLFMRFQFEFVIQKRRKRREAKMDDAKVEKMRGIMRDSEMDENPLPKDASPLPEDASPLPKDASLLPKLQDENSFYQIWIMPSIYVLFRKLGIY